MLSISETRTPSAMVSYITGPNAEKNYYNEHGGVWHGEGARRLGLAGTVTDAQFKQIMYGYGPDGSNVEGKALVQNAGSEKRDAGRDFTFSAPKSVSAVWAICEPDLHDEIQHCMHRSATRALDFMSRHAATGRVGGGGLQREPVDMLYMLYQHGSSRLSKAALDAGHEADPQLHIHAIGANIGVREDGSTGAVVFRDMYAWKMATGAAFRVQLAWELTLAGLDIERDREFFKVAGVPDSLVDEMSKRSDEIAALMAERALSGGRAAEYANLSTRISKKEAELEAIRAQALRTAAEHGFTPEMIRRNRDVTPPTLNAVVAEKRRAAVQQAFEADSQRLSSLRIPAVHLREFAKLTAGRDEAFKRIDADERNNRGRELFIDAAIKLAMTTKAVLHEPEIYQAVFEAAQGLVSLKEAEEIAEQAIGKMIALERDVERSGKYVKEYAWTTDAMRAMEIENRDLLAKIALGNRALDPALAAKVLAEHLAARSEPDKPFVLNAGQLAVVELASKHRLVVITGDAGTGKSTAANAIRAQHEASGYRVIGVAPIGKAVGELRKSSDIEDTFTVDSLLIQIKNGKLTLGKNDLILVDEAGLMGTRQANELYKAIAAAGSKLALVGDDKQTQPYNAGNAFPAAAKVVEHQARLTEIQRQNRAADAAAFKQDIIYMRDGDAALAMLGRLQAGHVHVVKDEQDMAGAITAKYIELHDRQVANGAEPGGRMDPVFAYARTNERVDKLNAEIRSAFKERGALTGGVVYTTLDGSKIELAVGERIMVDKNDYRQVEDGKGGRKAKLVNANGDTGTVVAIMGEDISVQFDDGETRTLKVAEMGIRYGYASTVAKSQGSSPENTVVWGSVDMSREDAYTAITRAKLEGHWFFSNASIEKMARGAPVPADWVKAARRIEKSRVELGLTPELTGADHSNFNAVRNYLIRHGELLLQKREQHGALDTLKTLCQQRGDTPAAIEQTLAFAKAGIMDNRAHAGTLLEHGAAHYDHNADNNLSYYVKLAQPDGSEQTVWGKDLQRHALDGRLDAGSQVLLSYRGNADVTVMVDERDAENRKTGNKVALDTVRNEWAVTEVGELAQQAAHARAAKPDAAASMVQQAGSADAAKPDSPDTAAASKARVEKMLATPKKGAFAVDSAIGKLADTLHAMSTSNRKVNVDDYVLRGEGNDGANSVARAQHPAIRALQSMYEARGAEPEDIAQAVQLASGSFEEGRAYAGRVTDHGAAPYEWDDDNSRSYYVTLALPDGSEQTVWGADFSDAADAGKIALGQDVFISYKGSQPVTVPGPGGVAIQTHRNAFEVSELGEMMDRAAIPAPAEPVKAAPTVERAAPVMAR